MWHESFRSVDQQLDCVRLTFYERSMAYSILKTASQKNSYSTLDTFILSLYSSLAIIVETEKFTRYNGLTPVVSELYSRPLQYTEQ